MKSAILVESKKPLLVENIELPENIKFGQVLVKIYYSGICGAQINEIDALKGPDKFLPHLLGHEGSGIVEKVGEGVKTVKPGDHVVLHWRPGDGIQSSTAEYNWNGKKINSGWVTTFNEKAVVSKVTSGPELSKTWYIFSFKFLSLALKVWVTPNDKKVVFVGVPTGKINIYTLPLAFKKTLLVSSGGACNPEVDIPRYIKLQLNKKINLNNFITHEFELSEINKAINLFRTGKAGRIILKINKE